MNADLRQRLTALRRGGWTIFTTGRDADMYHAERRHRGVVIREEGDDLARLIDRLEEHDKRLSTDDRTSLVEAQSGLSNI